MRIPFFAQVAGFLALHIVVACQGGPRPGSPKSASAGPDFDRLRESLRKEDPARSPGQDSPATGGIDRDAPDFRRLPKPYLKPRHYKARLDRNSEWGETLEVVIEDGREIAAMIHTTGTVERLIQYTYRMRAGELTEVEQLTFHLRDERGNLRKKTLDEPRVLRLYAADGSKVRTEGHNPGWPQGEEMDFPAEFRRHLEFFSQNRERFSEVTR